MSDKRTDETYWRVYLESLGLSGDELDAKILADLRDAAARTAAIEEKLAFIALTDPERAARIRAEFAAKERAATDRWQALRNLAIAPEPKKSM